MGKTLGYVGVALVGTLLLYGCSGPEEEVAQHQPHSVAEERASEPEPSAQQVEPLNVMISTAAFLRPDRRLMVEGEHDEHTMFGRWCSFAGRDARHPECRVPRDRGRPCCT